MNSPLREFLKTPDLCPHCYTGTDDDHDGDCSVCARLPEKAVSQMRMVALMTIVAAEELVYGK